MKQVSKKLQKEWLELRGTVKVDGKFGEKRIAIFDRNNLIKTAVRHSNKKDGIWRWRVDEAIYPLFERENRFMAVAMDDTKTFNADVLDYLSLYKINVTVNL